ncbi:hypothetical protein Tco_1146704 [Tanacetum coccineum]
MKEVVKESGAKRKKSLPRTRGTVKRQKLEEDAEKEDLKGYLDIVPREEGDGSSKNYKVLSEMLEDFDRQDVMNLYRLVKERYSASRPEGYDLMLWGDLYTLFEPDEEDEIWRNQHEYNLISQRLCDFCGVHILLMHNGIAIHMFTENKYPLSQEMLSKMMSKRLEVPIPVTAIETGPSTGLKMTVPSTAEENFCKKNDVKAKSLLLMALLNEHQLTFDQYVDAQSMFAAIKARFGGNKATKKTQKA